MKRDVPHFRIGLLLTEAGILAPQQLDEAIQRSEQEGLPFLRMLVTSGSLQQHELQAVIRAQQLIWSGLLDVERAILALDLVHKNNVSIDEGLQWVGWNQPEGLMKETIQGMVSLSAESGQFKVSYGNGSRICQYCATPLRPDSTLCSFCTGDNPRAATTARVHVEPAWQMDPEPSGPRVQPANPARSPALMAFLSGCCLAGFGQLALGQQMKGAIMMFVALLCAFITHNISSLLIFPLAALDAFLLADKLRKGKSVGLWEFF